MKRERLKHFPLGPHPEQLEAWLDHVGMLLDLNIAGYSPDNLRWGWRSAVRAARNLAEFLGATIPPRELTTHEEGRSFLLVCRDAIFAAIRRRVDCQKTAHATDTPAAPRHEGVSTPAAPEPTSGTSLLVATTPDRDSLERLAIAAVIRGETKICKIADEIGVPRTTLYGYTKFRETLETKKAQREQNGKRLRGQRTGDDFKRDDDDD